MNAVARLPLDTDLAEDQRLEALDRLDVLDSPQEESFDGIARLIRNIFKVEIGIVSVIDAHRQWFKACEGFAATQVERKETICSYTIRERGPLIVPDTLKDPRFANHPHVVGEPFVRFYAGVPLTTRDGHNIGTVCAVDFKPREFGPDQVEMLNDLARVAMSEFELRQFLATDVLTNLLSRRALKDEGARALAMARRHELDLSVIVFDLDHFKMVNDTHGHATGDAVLAGIAARCTEAVRKSDHLGRLGGEEFALILPHTDRRGAMEAAEKLRRAVEAMAFQKPYGGDFHVTASFGVATLDTDVDDIDALIARADSALYEAKAAGRNRSVRWRPTDAERGARRRGLKAGTIIVNQGRSTVDCTIRSLGDDGAGIDVSSTMGLPETFRLRVKADATEFDCRTTSRTDRHVEVEFL